MDLQPKQANRERREEVNGAQQDFGTESREMNQNSWLSPAFHPVAALSAPMVQALLAFGETSQSFHQKLPLFFV